MKVYISADLEGITGVVGREHVNPEGSEYQRARDLMTREVNAAIKGAYQGGAEHVVVNDAHGPMTNLMIENLETEAELITGTPKPQGMMAGLTEEFDLVFLIGYHSKKGDPGILSHSYSGGTVKQIKLNGLEVGEPGMNSYLAGYYQVPVGLVTGDDRVTTNTKDLIGEQLKTVAVKSALSRSAAKCMTPTKACKLIEERATQAVSELSKKKYTILTAEKPLELSMSFLDRGMAEKAAQLPNTKLENTTVIYQHDDMLSIYEAMQAMLMLVR
ncbi:M55 family metallopeptidase [Natranaerobius thermophilus]|uniref:Peptidase M55 D-aminopeptidase n=1 Tax=Natranaerobius thermophilus (strain ATCC BAA-1301 / DSM 18059 / JW/NM-WN-LF) TaxID=457570 RepID=B2A576_NATTJ|nr:M55 family metallopeptidase [Natranaerobius thermophilus]ACB83910.1 peptidase M55 D-aminopeptidase [Natranaerobius thermophilus JW/NM-WN-LF]